MLTVAGELLAGRVEIKTMNSWPERYAAHWLQHPRLPVSYEAAMISLELLIKNAKLKRAQEHESHSGEEGDKLAYLRGPLGQRDRDTLYKDGKGTIGGEGGFVVKNGD